MKLALLLLLLPVGSAAVHEVHIIDSGDQQVWQFSPRSLDVEVGDTVRFIDDVGEGSHTATSNDAGFDFRFQNRVGESFSWTASKTGDFDFYCQPHPWMSGTISVYAEGEAPTQTTSSTSSTGSSNTGSTSDTTSETNDQTNTPRPEQVPAPLGLFALAALAVLARRRA